MSYRFEAPKPKKEMPAGWRGIGCFLIMIFPVVSYFAAVDLLKNVDSIHTFFVRALPGLLGPISIHPLLRRITSLAPLWDELRSINNLGANLVLGVVILLILSGIVSVIYGIMYRTIAPSKYGPTDAPPQKRRKGPKKYSR
jgi:hypothetical protein